MQKWGTTLGQCSKFPDWFLLNSHSANIILKSTQFTVLEDKFGDICRFYHGASCFTSDLDDSTDRWAIVVRVFRKWNVYQKYAPAELFCVSMVLIDEEGRTIQASVLNNRNLLDKFQISIVEGQIYKFANFEVTSNVNQYRASSHPFKITFTPDVLFKSNCYNSNLCLLIFPYPRNHEN
ncbi:hypothetical protein K1719_006864 [Acacia pycnantha]|nr:hypothetical protein K1719_006864 [Acacia pycnantha]